MNRNLEIKLVIQHSANCTITDSLEFEINSTLRGIILSVNTHLRTTERRLLHMTFTFESNYLRQ